MAPMLWPKRCSGRSRLSRGTIWSARPRRSSTRGSDLRSCRPGYWTATSSRRPWKCWANGWYQLAAPPACGKQTSRGAPAGASVSRRSQRPVSSVPGSSVDATASMQTPFGLRKRLETARLAGMGKSPAVELEVEDRVVRISNPDRVYFPARGETKLDLANYYLSVGDGIVRALRERPCMLHRFPEGVTGEKVHQKRLPHGAPPWVRTVRVHFPRYNRHADELCVSHIADVIWAVQMSTVEFHPWNSRAADTEKPDEWRIDLDPGPTCSFDRVRRVAQVVEEVLAELGAVGFPKTSGSKGLHIYVRIKPDYGFQD